MFIMRRRSHFSPQRKPLLPHHKHPKTNKIINAPKTLIDNAIDVRIEKPSENINNDIDKIRQESAEKLDALRKQMVDSINEWVDDLKKSILNNVGYEQIQVLRQQMYGLHEEVNSLNNCIVQNNMNIQAIKKSYQIDADKLKSTYKKMVDKYRDLSQKMKIEVEFNQGKFIQAVEKSISLEVNRNSHSSPSIIKVDEEDSGNGVIGSKQVQDMHRKFMEARLHQKNYQQQQQQQQSQQQLQQNNDENIPILYNYPPGSSNLALCNFQTDPPSFSQHEIPCNSYPLNSIAVLPNDMLIMSGGMVSQDEKSKNVDLIDYNNGTVLSSMQMKYGRSSHKTVVYNDKIFIVGGFCSETSECKLVQIVTGEGITVSPYQCNWGGPNLSIIHNNKLMKITLTAVECMNLDTLEWQQILSDVPFNLSKHMQIKKYKGKIYVFGDDKNYYIWNEKSKIFNQFQSQIDLNNISSSIVYGDRIIGWINSKDIVQFDGGKWSWVQ